MVTTLYAIAWGGILLPPATAKGCATSSRRDFLQLALWQKIKDLVKLETKNRKEKDGGGKWEEKPGIQAELQGVEKGREKNRHGREEGAERRSRQGTVRLQKWDQGAGKFGLRMALSQDCELCNSYGGSMDCGLDDWAC